MLTGLAASFLCRTLSNPLTRPLAHLRSPLPLPAPCRVKAFDDVMEEFLAKHHTSVRKRTGQPVGTDRKGVPLVYVRLDTPRCARLAASGRLRP